MRLWLWIVLLNYRKNSKNIWAQAAADYEKSLLREVKSNPKAFFRCATSKLNFQKPVSDLLDYVKIISDSNCQAKAFDIFFKIVFTKESDHLQDFDLTAKSSIENVSFPTDKIKMKLENLNSYKSPEADE